MIYITEANITQRTVDSFRDCESPRLKEIMRQLVQHMHAFARDSRLTMDEWFFAMDFLHRAGQISDATRNEFMGLSDTLGLTSLVELRSETDPKDTPVNLLGPFYVEDAPKLSLNEDLKGDLPGEPTLLRGRVLDRNARPISGALINFWQTQADGLYDVQVAGLQEPRFRGWMRTEADGSYQVRTIRPVGYTAPMDGPLGEMLIHTNRNEWRPAHWHFLIRAEAHRQLVTELYPKGSLHLDDDVAFGPREALIVELTKVEDAAEAERFGMPVPFYKAEFDFKLAPL